MESPPERNAVYRRAATTPRRVRELAFDRLPPAVRDRLTRGVVHGAPEPLLAAPSGRAPLVRRALRGAALAAAAALIGVAVRDFGDLDGTYALQPASFAALYGALFFVVVAAGAAAVALGRLARGAPFRSGRYLFPLDLVEVSGGRLRVTSLDTLRDVEAQERAAAIRFEDGHAVVFPLAKHDDAAAVAARVQRAVEAARAWVMPADAAALERLDVFFELRVADDWDAAAVPSGGRGRSPLVWIAAAAVLGAAPAGAGLLRARNALSDDAMFDEATTARPGDALPPRLLAYVAHGRRHRDEARRLLVEAVKDDHETLSRHILAGGPTGVLADDAFVEVARDEPEELSWYLGRGGAHAAEADEALFAIARRMDTLAGYNTYLEHGERHADEVRQVLLPEADFAQAARSELVGSLFSFVRRNPGSKHEDEAWRLIRKTYAEALPAFRAAERPPADGLRFAEALLTSLQDRADPRVDLVISMVAPASVAEADRTLGARYGARYLAASRRFSGSSLDELSADVRGAVSGWFGRVFPRGVVEATRPSAAEEGRPRIDVRCEPVADGAAHWRAPGATSDEPEIVTPAVRFDVEVRAVVLGRDGEDTTLAWQVRIEDDSEGKMLATDFRGEKRDPHEMIEDAFARFLEGVPARIVASFHEKL